MKTVEPPCLEDDLVNLVCDICARASRTKDERPDKGDLMRVTGYSSNVVMSGYLYRRTPEVRRNILCGFAQLYQIDPGRLLRHDERRDDAALQALLELELRKMRCTGEGPHLTSAAGLDPGWFDPLVDEDLIVPTRAEKAPFLCRACARRKADRVGDGWGELLKRNAFRLPTAINLALAALEAKGRAPGYKGIAEEAKMSYADVRRTLAAAGLEKERKGRKNFGRYLPIWLVVFGYLFGGKSAEAAVAAPLRQPDPQVYLIGGIRAWLLEQFRRWAQADRLRQWLAGLAGAAAPALGAAS